MSNAKLRQYAVEQLLTACRESANFLGMDLEEYRITAILTYDQLAEMIGGKSVSQMRRLCIGAELLRDLRLEKAIEISGGAVTAFAVHRRRVDLGGPRRPSVLRSCFIPRLRFPQGSQEEV